MEAKVEPRREGAELTIAGTVVAVTHETVSIDSLRLDPDNPRIWLQISHGTRKKPRDDEELLAIIRAQPGYDHLHKQIRKQGGIHDPLIVRHNGTIIEGNTRFAVVCFLAKPDRSARQWTSVPVTRLAQDVPERTVQLLMANYHIAGKTNWRPAAQAAQIYRLIEDSNVPVEEVADATRMSPKKVRIYVQAYKYLIKEVIPEVESDGKINKQEILDKKFSHALELMTVKKLEPVREDPVARKKVAKLIATDKIQGAQMRQLPTILQNAKANEVLAKEGFKAASDVLKKVDPTTDSKVLKSMQSLTTMLASIDQSDIELFKKQSKATSILQDLFYALREVMTIAKVQEGKRDAH